MSSFRSAPRAFLLSTWTALLSLSIGCTICTDQIWNETTSPDGKWTTRSTTRDCGRTIAPTTGVYLQPATYRERRLGEIIFLVKHPHAVEAKWQSPTLLVITCPHCGGDVRVERTSAGGIHIDFHTQ